jgi:hypothetical protein
VQRGAFGLSFVYRDGPLREPLSSEGDTEVLRGNLALCRYRQSETPEDKVWAGYATALASAYDAALKCTGPLVRLAAEGEIELTTGEFGLAGAAEEMVTVRVFFDREHAGPADRAMVMEFLWSRDDLASLLGPEPARRVQNELASYAMVSNAVSLRDEAIALNGTLAERIRTRQWDAALANRYPALAVLSIGEALELATRHLPHPFLATAHGLPEQVLNAIQQDGKAAEGRRAFSLTELARFGQTLKDAQGLLQQRDAIGAKWAAQRLGHLLEASTELSLQPRMSHDHPVVRQPRYVIAEDVPYAAAVPGTDMGEQQGGRFYWGLHSWVRTKREAQTFDLHGAERELQRLLPHCPRASLVPAEVPPRTPRVRPTSDLPL